MRQLSNPNCYVFHGAYLLLTDTRAQVPTFGHWEMKDPSRLIPVQYHCQTLPTAIYGRGTQHLSDIGLSFG